MKKKKKKIRRTTTYSQAEQHNHNTFYKQHNSDLKAVRRGQPQVLPPPGHFREWPGGGFKALLIGLTQKLCNADF